MLERGVTGGNNTVRRKVKKTPLELADSKNGNSWTLMIDIRFRHGCIQVFSLETSFSLCLGSLCLITFQSEIR